MIHSPSTPAGCNPWACSVSGVSEPRRSPRTFTSAVATRKIARAISTRADITPEETTPANAYDKAQELQRELNRDIEG